MIKVIVTVFYYNVNDKKPKLSQQISDGKNDFAQTDTSKLASQEEQTRTNILPDQLELEPGSASTVPSIHATIANVEEEEPGLNRTTSQAANESDEESNNMKALAQSQYDEKVKAHLQI